MKPLLNALVLAGMTGLTASAAQAEDNVVLVELFTSQGCSSCPPADRNLARLAERRDILPLSMHVDYWDYLGWRDTFARREHTERQYDYRRMLGTRVVYTPQMIIQGQADVPGYQPEIIDAAITKAARQAAGAQIAIEHDTGMFSANITGAQTGRACTIWVASYTQEAAVDIERGENAGQTITYHNVVEKLMRVGPRDDAAAQTISLPKPETGEGIAVWLQDDQTGEIVAASFVEN